MVDAKLEGDFLVIECTPDSDDVPNVGFKEVIDLRTNTKLIIKYGQAQEVW